MKARLLLAAVFAVLLAGRVAGGRNEESILAKAQAAQAETYYQGLLLTSRRSGSGYEEEVARVWFGPGGRQAQEIISPLWRNGERIIVDGTHYWLYYPDCNAALRLPAADRPPMELQVAEARLEGTEYLGGRETYVMRWESDGGTRRVWFDAERYVPLKREDRNGRGELILAQTLHEVQFPFDPPLERLRFEPDPGLALYTEEDAFHRAVSLDHVQRGVDFRLRLPGFLPAGMTFRRATLRALPQITVVQMRFADDAGKEMSLFQFRISKTIAPPERQFMAEVGADSGRVKLSFTRWKLGDLEFVLIGNISLDQLQQVARSVK